ncbi:lysophospholipid acyltransferase family protein [Colwellia sp. E2M01]|uniref:lysophospholipid acyltransferase family protein n=1 Tax=Colwellia sp. E2M01 TaxID=2841561 RepID=UPI001C0A6209|nr:lysophospholipid acyltransferase family protein [Colwellia sp. E2M01]MBU2871613.1 1-acyl-sn-glycerol-3-phosphate acyltransferase [Colwellia sp. E2M01]
MINHYWRLFATGTAFFLFSLGGGILSLFVFPIVRLLYLSNENKRRSCARKIVHKTFKMFIGYMQLVGIMKVEFENAELLKASKGNIVIANHPSLIDVVVLISIIENADCVVKADLWKNPFLKGVVRNTGYINNESDPDKFMQDCTNSFNEGNNLIVFPEGTRTTPGKAMQFKRGAANIALRTKTNMTPILLFVTPSTLSKELAWYQVPERRFTFKLVVKPEIDVAKYLSTDVVSNSVRELTRDLLKYYNEELNLYERVN